MDEVRVCVVGAGRAGIVHATNFRWRVSHARLVAVVDVDGERASRAARDLDLPDAAYSSLESAVQQARPDAVVITTPTPAHPELVEEAGRAGLHVLCEKPMALTLEGCDRMLEAARSAGVILQIGFMRRFDPAFAAAKQQILDGAIGRPLIVRSLTRGPGLPPPWARDPRTSNGLLAEVNSHDFDTIRWLGGGEMVLVFALANALKAVELRREYPGFNDTAVVVARLDNEAFGMIDGVCPADYGYDARAEVVGSEGVLFIGESRQRGLVRLSKAEGHVEQHFLTWRERFAQAYRDEAEHFVACIRGEAAPAVTGWDGRRALEAVLAANESIQTGQPVGIPVPASGA